ncbi:hypothetical protein SBOR_1797 [Sclerotinia borealis F-4128]|uniref:Uncharacterized protein n=1 Tax=Sclerotinia borealis (strain F-4128) TaxID=1432307 RepID=W9CP39_SCLBF|nr:hypothetical protein SBOR_1797 [Sclerotinia borealis F-4128]
MPERRHPSNPSNTNHNAPIRPSVRRNLFSSHLRTSRTATSSITTPTTATIATITPAHPIPSLPRRPTTSSTSTSAETLRLDHAQTFPSTSNDRNNSNSNANSSSFPQNTYGSRSGSALSLDGTTDIVVRDKNGDFDIANMMLGGGMDNGGELLFGGDDEDVIGLGEGAEEEKERQRLNDSIKHHQRDRNRAPSEPAELLEAVRSSLRAKTAALTDDNWIFEAENEGIIR